MSEIVFEVNGQRITRHGNTSVANMIAQATKEFGEINVVSQEDTDIDIAMTIEQHIHILEVAAHNIQTAHDQLHSLSHELNVSSVKGHLLDAIDAAQKQIEALRGIR